MQFLFTGFTQDKGFRVPAVDGIGEDRTRTPFTVRTDLGLIARHGIRVPQLPLSGTAFLKLKQSPPTKLNRSRSENSTAPIPVLSQTGERKTGLIKDPVIDVVTVETQVVTFWRNWFLETKLREEAVARKAAVRKRVGVEPEEPSSSVSRF